MNITRLKLNNYRNIGQLELKLNRQNIILAPNGTGKTNLLEAVFVLALGRSYRARRDRNIIGPINNVARVEADIFRNKNDLSLALAQNGDQKIAFINDKKTILSEYVGTLKVVLFAPEDMDLVMASPAKRRRSLDILLTQTDTGYAKLLLQYNHILKARNNLLQGISAGRNHGDELKFWNEEIIRYGQAILEARLKIVDEINREIGPVFNLFLSGRQNGWRGIKDGVKMKYLATVDDTQKYADALAHSFHSDLKYGQTQIGPHRDDWEMHLGSINLRDGASRGEIRMALLALVAAEVNIIHQTHQQWPVLLLDDVFAELDRHHSDELISFWPKAQVIITATDAEYIPKKLLENASINKLEDVING